MQETTIRTKKIKIVNPDQIDSTESTYTIAQVVIKMKITPRPNGRFGSINQSRPTMSDTTQNQKQKKAKSLDEEIAAAQQKLNMLVAKKREEERKALERNQKAIAALLRTEKLDAVPIEQWTSALTALRKLLKVEAPKGGEAGTPSKPQTDSEPSKSAESPALQEAA